MTDVRRDDGLPSSVPIEQIRQGPRRPSLLGCSRPATLHSLLQARCQALQSVGVERPSDRPHRRAIRALQEHGPLGPADGRNLIQRLPKHQGIALEAGQLARRHAKPLPQRGPQANAGTHQQERRVQPAAPSRSESSALRSPPMQSPPRRSPLQRPTRSGAHGGSRPGRDNELDGIVVGVASDLHQPVRTLVHTKA